VSRDLRRQAELLRSLGHPTRLAILQILQQGPKCVRDVRELLDVSQPNLSQHLAQLRHHGIVDCYEEGNLRCYYLTQPAMVEALWKLIASESAEPSAPPLGEVPAGRRNTQSKSVP